VRDAANLVATRLASEAGVTLGEELGAYADRKLHDRNVKVIKGMRVTSYDGQLLD
jgi:hypothetical protein